MTEKILFVDDDTNLLASYQRRLRKRFTLDTAEGGEAGLAKLAVNGPYALVVADRQMPGMDGTRFLSLVQERAPDTVRIMLTGNVDLEAAIRTVNEGGIFRFLTKPCSAQALSRALQDALAQYRLVISEKELLTHTLNGSIKLLTDILSLTHAGSFGNSHALRDAITTLAGRLQLTNAWEIHLAVMLAPIGYVSLPPELLIKSRKGEPLSEVESATLAQVPDSSARLLANIPRLEGVARIVQYQQKHFDGSGWPSDPTAGESIPVGSRLLKILSDALELENKGMARPQALNELQRRNGEYDSALLSAVRAHWESGPAATSRFRRARVALPLKQLAVGMLLGADVEAGDGTVILTAGQHLNDMGLEKLENFARLAAIREPILVETIVAVAPAG